MKQLALYLLGPYQVTLDGEPVTEFRSDKVRALLAYLAMEAGIPHRRDALAGLFWPNVSDTTARKNLRLSLHRLRQAIDDLEDDSAYFQITRETIQFRPAAVWVDALAFAERLAASQRHEHHHPETCSACMEQLSEAAELYRGDFMAGFFLDDCLAFSEWVLVKREGLHRQILPTLYHLTAYHQRRGELEQAQAYARRQLELEPWREEAHRQLMEVLARSGETSAALAQYEICRRTLAEELNIEPDQETERWHERIQMARVRRHHNLPPQATPFVGREKELARIAELLADPDCRLLTILGPGGIGKTRLALQAALEADEQARQFLHGVAFVPLAGVEATEFLVPAIANALDFSFPGIMEPDQQLIDYLRRKEILLILDSFEQLLDGTAFLLALLEGAPEVKLLVTSRERLNLHWEWLLPLEGLPYPDFGFRISDFGFEISDVGSGTADTEIRGSQRRPELLEGSETRNWDAVRLFQVCARRVQPGFELTGGTERAVIDLCRTVEGMPLAVELAAAWVGTLPMSEIATEIARNLDLSAAAMRHMPARHRSLRAVFDHTWGRLSPVEQQALAQCAVFRDRFTREAAEAVISAQSTVKDDETDYCLLITDHCLASLVDKSLLRFGPAGRYEMHELLRQYAAKKLAAVPQTQTAARDRHCAYYAGLLQRQEAELAKSGAAEILAAIKAEIANIHAAWRWAVRQAKLEEIERSVDALSHFYLSAGPFQEGTMLIEMAVDRVRALVDRADKPARDRQSVLSKLLAEQARLLNRQGMYDQAVAATQAATELARTSQAVDLKAAGCLQWGIALHHMGEYEAARTQLERVVTLAQAAQSKANLRPRAQPAGLSRSSVALLRQVEADGRRNLGAVSINQGDYAAAKAYSEQALHIYRETGDRRGESGALNNLGAISYGRGDYAAAKAYCEQTLHIFREIGDRGDESTALSNLGLISVEQGDYAAAEVYFEQALHVCRAIGDRPSEGTTLINLGLLFHRIGEYARARAHYRHALRIYREIGDRRTEGLALSCLCLLSHHLGDEAPACEYGQQAVQTARNVGDPNVLGYALTRLGHALVDVGRLAEAAEIYQEALTLRRELGQSNLALETLAGLARVSMAQNDSARAQAEVEEILRHLEEGADLDGTDEPCRIYLTCYRVLAANQDARAPAVLYTAHTLLQEQAARIDDRKLRQLFLEKVPAHQEIVAEIRG